MPIYSLVALLLSLFGATYTVMANFRNSSEAGLKEEVEGTEGRLTFIKNHAGPEGEVQADEYAQMIRTRFGVWLICHYVPLGFFCVVILVLSILCLVYWNDVTLPVLPNQLPERSQSVCEAGWWMLLFALVINIGSGAGAVISRHYVLSRGKLLTKLHKTVEETVQRQRFVANPTPPLQTSPPSPTGS